jgi:putative ubiquitin-RnfH superfamily antitoxin RatB of RatAB toxin-antitoxin module
MDKPVSEGQLQAQIRVEVVYAEPQRQWLMAVELPAGSLVRDAIVASGIGAEVPGLDIHPDRVGIFGQKATLDQVLVEGDRVELYRPLLIEPKEARRLKAEAQQKGGDKPA